MVKGPIGVFDSGYGGLTILREITRSLPQYNYLYLGDNARTPYGPRSFDTIYEYTSQCVRYLFEKGCHLIILACNTASAKALRNIQQKFLPGNYPERRVLGVIRPTTEIIGTQSHSKKVGILGTTGTIQSQTYPIEIHRHFPEVEIFQQACPMWVPLVEYGEYDNEGTEYFVRKNLEALYTQSEEIDTLILACTHYPLLIGKIKKFVPEGTTIIDQGKIVASSLKDYLDRHPEMEEKCLKAGTIRFQTTDSTDLFNQQAGTFFGEKVTSEFVHL